MTLQEWANALAAKHHAKVLQAKSRPWRPTATPATDLGYACERRIQYHRLLPELARPLSEELACIFNEGDLHERDVRRALDELGVELVENQLNFRREDWEITGTIDGKLVVDLDGRRRKIPCEIKSTTGGAPSNEEEWRDSESGLLIRYFAQLQIYMLLAGEEDGLLIFKNKATGQWQIVAVKLDLVYCEQLLKKAERVRDAVRAYKAAASDEDREAAMLPRLANRSECTRCPWFDECRPADADVDPLLVAQDEAFAAQLRRRLELDPARREYTKLNDKVRERLDLTKGEQFIIPGEPPLLVRKKPHGKSWQLKCEPLQPDLQPVSD